MTAGLRGAVPAGNAGAFTAQDWAGWFWSEFLPDWRQRATDAQGGLFDTLNAEGMPDASAEKTVLAQARALFTLAHLAVLSGDAALTDAARRQVEMLRHFRKAPGLYRRAASRDGAPLDNVARSYDQTFVILGLATWHRLSPSPEIEAEIEACWHALMTQLTNPATGLLIEDDSVTSPGAPDAPLPAQNPHMHLYEACLQAFEMSGRPLWLQRAAGMRDVALRHFRMPDADGIAEFLTPGLHPLREDAGFRREPGHQCEWAWLLRREVELGGKADLLHTAEHLEAFVEAQGFASQGALKGAAFDAVLANGCVTEPTHLLWPQTEAIKMFAVRHMAGKDGAAERATALLCLMFERWFANRPTFVNRLDAEGRTLWPAAPTRLLYHLVLALTEGARAGLWPGPSRAQMKTEGGTHA